MNSTNNDSNYIDGFVLPIPRAHLGEYKKVVGEVSGIWMEHGALAYNEYVGEDLAMDGVRAFTEMAGAREDEVIIFGWVVFRSKKERDLANERVASDPRMQGLVAPLTDPSRKIFNAARMAYGGFRSLVSR